VKVSVSETDSDIDAEFGHPMSRATHKRGNVKKERQSHWRAKLVCAVVWSWRLSQKARSRKGV
jgi:hypothetical protein